MTDFKLIGWRAAPDEVALAEAVREETGEISISAVLRKSLKCYAKEKGVA